MTATAEGRPRVVLACRGLEVGHAASAILPAIDLEIGAGELWAVVGRNGSGKSTWLRTVLGLLPPVRGAVELARPDLRLSYVPQRKETDDLHPLLARDVVSMGLDRGWSFVRQVFGRPSQEVDRALEEMGVAALAGVPFRKLSEGQKQRVMFARLAVSRAEVALLDEPTSAMDQVAEHEAFRILDGLRKRQGLAIVIVSHYLGMVRRFADRALLLDRDENVVVVGTPEEVFAHDSFQARFSERPHQVKSLEAVDE